MSFGVKKTLLGVISAILTLICTGLLYYFWLPIALWYWNFKPVLGVDFYNLATYVGYLSRHFSLRFWGWKYASWLGGPWNLEYPSLHAYLALPLLRFFSLIQSLQLYALGSTFLFLLFSFLLISRLSRNKILSLILTIAISFSPGLYGALFWGGSLQYYSSQFFLPLVLLLLIIYAQGGNRNWFYLGAFFLGVSFLAHPQPGYSYTIPFSVFIILFFTARKNYWRKIKDVIVFLVLAVIFGYPQMGVYLGRSPVNIMKIGFAMFADLFKRPFAMLGTFKAGEHSEIASSSGVLNSNPSGLALMNEFNKSQFGRFVTDTHPLLFFLSAVAIALFLFSVIIARNRKKTVLKVIWILPAVFIVGYIWLFTKGVALSQGGWYRSFWAFPLALSIMIGAFWKLFWDSVWARKQFLHKIIPLRVFLILISSAFLVCSAAYFFILYPAKRIINQVDNASYRQQSSAFPDSLNYYISKSSFENLKTKLVPSWIDPNRTDYRLFENDQRVNIWWSSLFDMPLVKGYVEIPPGDSATGVFYLSSIALTGSENYLTKSWGYSEEMAKNNALFLIDWLSIKYIEAEHEGTDSYNPLASYLSKSDLFSNKEKVTVPGWSQLYSITFLNGQTTTGGITFYPENPLFLTYYELKDEYVSPIGHTTNASVFGIIGSDESYQTILRDLAVINLNSRYIIPVHLAKSIDSVNSESLNDMDAVILYGYSGGKRSSWGELEEYVKNGGKVFIETGATVEQTDSQNLELPALFPVNKTSKKEIGVSWQLKAADPQFRKIKLKDFGDPVIESKPWLFSLPEGLRQNAQSIITSQDIPLIASWKYGSGEVIWSGMNLPYHISTYKNMEEANFLKALLERLSKIEETSYKDYVFERTSPSRISVTGSSAKGVMFREQSYPDWYASLESGKRLRLYHAGPSYYGYSFVVIPKEVRGESFKVNFTYYPDFWVWFWEIVWVCAIITLFDKVILGGKLIIPILRKIKDKIGKNVGGWWGKDEE